MSTLEQVQVDRVLFSRLLRLINVLDSATDGANSASSWHVIETARHRMSSNAQQQIPSPCWKMESLCKNFSGLTGRLGIEDYLSRIVMLGGPPANSCIDVATILMSRLHQAILSEVEVALGGRAELNLLLAGCRFVLPTPLLFRAALTAMVLAIKLQSDVFHTMAHYGFAGGVSAQQLIKMELAFLHLIEYDLSLPASCYRYFQEHIWSSQDDGLLDMCSPFLQSLPSTPPMIEVRSLRKKPEEDEQIFEDTFISEGASSVHTPTTTTLPTTSH